jgi:hypothetical protein
MSHTTVRTLQTNIALAQLKKTQELKKLGISCILLG